MRRMIQIRKSEERGRGNHGWLDNRHSFSFADYFDEKHMGFRALRVINEDRVAPGRGFGTHPHRDMEIISYVLEGALTHRDSMGNSGLIAAGNVQRMSAGTGVSHSEANASTDQPVHFLQIWLVPDVTGVVPSYEERILREMATPGQLTLVASPDGNHGSMRLQADARVFAGIVGDGSTLVLPVPSDRYAYVHVARGELTLNGFELTAGDGAALSSEAEIRLTGTRGAEVLVFDLA
jgi:redox-sensitive bicupin YhaK (pirin superfamily)